MFSSLDNAKPNRLQATAEWLDSQKSTRGSRLPYLADKQDPSQMYRYEFYFQTLEGQKLFFFKPACIR